MPISRPAWDKSCDRAWPGDLMRRGLPRRAAGNPLNTRTSGRRFHSPRPLARKCGGKNRGIGARHGRPWQTVCGVHGRSARQRPRQAGNNSINPLARSQNPSARGLTAEPKLTATLAAEEPVGARSHRIRKTRLCFLKRKGKKTRMAVRKAGLGECVNLAAPPSPSPSPGFMGAGRDRESHRQSACPGHSARG